MLRATARTPAALLLALAPLLTLGALSAQDPVPPPEPQPPVDEGPEDPEPEEPPPPAPVPVEEGGAEEPTEAPGGSEELVPAEEPGDVPAPGAEAEAGAEGAAEPAGAPEAAWRAAWDAELARRAADDFQLCDFDRNGWLSFREASQTLELEREEFLRYDTDRDGRLDPAEFEGRFRVLMERIGRVAEPRIGLPSAFAPAEPEAGAEDEAAADPALAPYDLLRRFDADTTRGLGLTEVARLFRELEIEVDPLFVVKQMDADGTAQLELEELSPLTALVARRLAERGTQAGAAPGSFWTSRPLPRTPFQRLDVDADGRLHPAELDRLTSPARLEVRAAAIVAALDLNGDGAIDGAEFRASMGH